MELPTLYMMVGLPGSGKTMQASLISRNLNCDSHSAEEYTKQYAEIVGKTYQEVYTTFMEKATTLMYMNISEDVRMTLPLIWDACNHTAADRVKKLQQLPNIYTLIAVHMDTPVEVCKAANLYMHEGLRTPDDVMDKFIAEFEPPKTSEGFDAVEVIKSIH